MKKLACAMILLSAGLATAQPEVIVPGDNLVVDGIPPIPAAVADKVNRYTEFRSAIFNDWHPTRREMLISTRFGDTAQVHLLKAPGGARTQLTFFPDSVMGAAFQPTQGNYFVFTKSKGGNERNQIYRYDLTTGNVTLLTDGKSRNSGGLWSRKGDRLVYGSTRRTGADVDLYLVEPASPKSDRLFKQMEGGGWFPLDWSLDDRHILVEEYVSINESYLWLIDSATGQKTRLTPASDEKRHVSFMGGKFSKDGQVFTTTDKDGEFLRLACIDLETKKIRILTDHIKWDVEEFKLSPDGKTIAFLVNEDGIGTLHLLDTASGKEREVPKVPAGSIVGIKWHRSLNELALQVVSARHPPDVYSLNLTTGKVERWTTSETGGLNTDNFVEPELVRWSSFDDRTISGFLYKPPARFKGKRPVIIDIHGGPESQARPMFLARKNFFLNEMGVALILPNIRGSSGYGKTFLTLDNGFQREDAYKDISTLLDWIKKRPDLDAERILVTGGSYGGHMTLAVATYYPDRIRCAVDIVGMSHLATFLKNTESYRRDLRRAEYGDERNAKMLDFMERIAPLNNARKISKPLFIIQGKNDPRVPASEAEQMVATLKKQNIPVWYLMAKDEGHGFAKKKNADFQFYATVMFVQKHLLD